MRADDDHVGFDLGRELEDRPRDGPGAQMDADDRAPQPAHGDGRFAGVRSQTASDLARSLDGRLDLEDVNQVQPDRGIELRDAYGSLERRGVRVAFAGVP